MLQLKLNMEKEGVHMSKRETYEARTEELITPILERMHFELVDVEYVKEGGTWYLRARRAGSPSTTARQWRER